jgi:hypothetical protein
VEVFIGQHLFLAIVLRRGYRKGVFQMSWLPGVGTIVGWLIEKMGALGLVWDVGSPREDIEDLALRHPLPKP